MDTQETQVYYAMITCGLFIIGVTLVHIFSSMWLHAKFEVKRRLRIKAELDSREAERLRISTDLHDGVGPMIYRIRRKVEDARDKAYVDKQLLDEGLYSLGELSDLLVVISKGLAPANLAMRGVGYCIEELVMETMMEHAIAIELRMGELPAIATDKAIHIYRIIEEITWNTIKYSRGDLLIIELVYAKGCLIMRTSDNGMNRVEGQPINKGGRGLGNIYARTKILNGSIAMDSSKGWKWERVRYWNNPSYR